jgi:hypothetical protein
MQIRNRIHLFTLLLIRIRLFNNADLVPASAPHQSDATLLPIGLQNLFCEPPRLHFGPIKLLNFYFRADSDATFHLNPGLYIITLEDEKLKSLSTVVQVGRSAGRQGG